MTIKNTENTDALPFQNYYLIKPQIPGTFTENR